MAKKPKAQPTPQPDAISVHVDGTETVDAATARTLTKPSVNAAATMHLFGGLAESGYNVNAWVRELEQQADAVAKGDLSRAEAVLVCQIHTLDDLFNNLARRANKQTTLPQYETFMRFALRAQSQCRAAVEALAEMKNPRPVAFVQQANIANGPQQVNNGTPHTRAEKANQSNELSGATSELLPHQAAPATAGTSNPTVEAVGAVYRP